jgi:hypothetical protein
LELDPARPSAADVDQSSMAAVEDRIAETGSLSQASTMRSPGDGACRPNRAALGNLPMLPRPGTLAGEASEKGAASGSVGCIADPSGAPQGLEAGHGSVDPTLALAPAAAQGLPGFAVPTDRTAEAAVEIDRSRGTGSRAADSVPGLPMPSDPVSRPRGFGRAGHDQSGNVGVEGGFAPVAPPIDLEGKSLFSGPFADGGEDWSPLRVPAREKVVVLAAETHFPPAGIPLPIDQIFQRVAADIQAPVAPADPRWMPGAAPDGGESRDAAAACIRSLTVLLEPATLGPVTIKLRLSGSSLGLEIEADERETTRVIGRGRPELVEKLRALGLRVDSFVVTEAGRPGSVP